MVGVPGRSKGCRTCRRRKKGCDRALPSCGQCKLAGLQCEGYGRDLVWVNATTEEPSKRRTLEPQAPWHVRYAGQAGPDVQIALKESLARTAREQKYLGMFWSAYLPNGRSFSPRASRLSTGGWTGSMGKLYDTEPTLQLASLAMSASVLGGQHNDPHLRVKGLQTYGRAIQEMGIAVKDPRRQVGDGLLAASRLMEFYEILFGMDAEKYPDARTHVAGWRGHNDGQMALVLMRGPGGLRSGAGHQLFADGRLNMIVGAIASRKRSLLASQEWKTIPWEQKQKSAKDRLLDVLMDIPTLLEGLDNLRNCGEPELLAKLKGGLLLECKRNHEAIVAWENEVGDELYIYDYMHSGAPLPVPKTDTDVALLQLTNLYWVVCLLLYSTMGFLMRPSPTASTDATSQSEAGAGAQYPSPSTTASSASTNSPASSFTSSPPPPQPSKPSDPRRDPRLCARKIAHSVHLFWEPSAGAFGNHIGLFPLGVAMRFLAALEPIEHSEPYQLMRKLFNRPFLGTFVGKFLSNLQQQTPKDGLRNMQGDEGIKARAKAWWEEGEQLPIRSQTPT